MPLYDLLVRTKDKTTFKRGDVLSLKLSSEANWTYKERNGKEWTIIQAYVTEEVAFSLLAPQLPPDLNHIYTKLAPRALSVDIDAILNVNHGLNRTNIGNIPTASLVDNLIVKERELEDFEL